MVRTVRGVQCLPGTTITLRGAPFPADDAVTVQSAHFAYPGPETTVSLLAVTVVNSSTITATLPELDDVSAAAIYGQYGTVLAVFNTSNVTSTTNVLYQSLYMSPNAPSITSVTSTMCDSVSALQLANCRATATITLAGDNLAHYDSLNLATSVGAELLGYNYLLPELNTTVATSSFHLIANNSLVFSLAYFDADTNTELRPSVVYTLLLLVSSTTTSQWDASNAFRLSLTYSTSDADTTSSSSALSSGAIAGVVLAAVVVALLLALIAVWFVRHPRPAAASSLVEQAGRRGLAP